ncbi:MAG: prolipoprotein diacylglyceryl transferase family protein, partial [Formosimonas sp.]
VMAVTSVFLMGYGVMRFLAEFAREPDDFLGLFAGLSMGQILSIPMIVGGALALYVSYRRARVK